MLSLRRGLCSSPLRVLGVGLKATDAEVKAAFRDIAKKWHPDRHHGAGKAQAEEEFKKAQQAYQAFVDGGGSAGLARDERRAAATRGPGGGTARGRGAGREAYGWGEGYGEASRPGYNPYKSYMGFGEGKGRHDHYWEDTAAAAKATDDARMWRMWLGIAVFGGGLFACGGTGEQPAAPPAPRPEEQARPLAAARVPTCDRSPLWRQRGAIVRRRRGAISSTPGSTRQRAAGSARRR